MHPLTLASLGILAGIALCTLSAPPPVIAIAIVWTCWTGFIAQRPGTPSQASGLSIAAWFLWGLASGVFAVASQPEGPLLRGDVSIDGVVAGAVIGREADVSVTAVRLGGDDAWGPASGRVRVTFPDGAPDTGTRWTISGGARPYTRAWLPGAPDPVASARLGRVRTWMWAESATPAQPPTAPLPGGGDRHGLIRAFLTGDRSDVTPEADRLLRATGTSHLLSVSGFHVATVALLTGGLLGWVLRLSAVYWRAGVPQWPAPLVGALAGFLYTEAAHAGIPGRRAALLFVVLALGRSLGRSPATGPALAAIAAILAALDPPSLCTPAFQLSFGAVAGLVTVSPALARFIPPDLPRPIVWLTTALVASCGATVGTLPACAWWFQEFAPSGPLANLVALPWTSAVIMPAGIGAAILPEPVASVALALATGAVDVLMVVLEQLATPLWSPAVGPFGVMLLCAPLVLPRRPMTSALAILTALALKLQPSGVLVVEQLDVGQGAATLIWFKDGTRWLVDGGPSGEGVLRYLRRRGIRRLDAVAATHPHLDHTGGLGPVLDNLWVTELWRDDPAWGDAIGEAASQRGIPIRRPAVGLHPPQGLRERDLNERSLVLNAGTDLLMMGDAGAKAEARMAGSLPQARILVVGHHGSKHGTSADLLAAVQPTVALIGVGRHNSYRHPHPTTLERLNEAAVQTLRTDLHGTIVLTVLPDQLVIQSRRAGSLRWTDPSPTTTRPPPPRIATSPVKN